MSRSHSFHYIINFTQVGRLDDEAEALALQAAELRRQLTANEHLSEGEREQLAEQLRKLEGRMGEAAAAKGAAAAAGARVGGGPGGRRAGGAGEVQGVSRGVLGQQQRVR